MGTLLLHAGGCASTSVKASQAKAEDRRLVVSDGLNLTIYEIPTWKKLYSHDLKAIKSGAGASGNDSSKLRLTLGSTGKIYADLGRTVTEFRLSQGGSKLTAGKKHRLANAALSSNPLFIPSPDDSKILYYRPLPKVKGVEQADLVVRDLATGAERIIGREPTGPNPTGNWNWDGKLFYQYRLVNDKRETRGETVCINVATKKYLTMNDYSVLVASRDDSKLLVVHMLPGHSNLSQSIVAGRNGDVLLTGQNDQEFGRPISLWGDGRALTTAWMIPNVEPGTLYWVNLLRPQERSKIPINIRSLKEPAGIGVVRIRE